MIIIEALHAGFGDFEDAVQYQSAMTNDIDIIITRNKQDFSNAKITVYTPEELIKSLR